MRSVIDRRRFIAGAAATATATAVAATGFRPGRGVAADPLRTVPADRRPALRGLNYDTEREVWNPEFVAREIATIATDLHANAVFLLGSDLDRLMTSARAAADNGLYVWFEPRQFDADAARTVEFVTSVADEAEALRADHPDVGLSLGVELTIFMDGLVPGGDWSERGEALGRLHPDEYNGKLNEFLAGALATIRPRFGGQVTYSSGEWEEVIWDDFDVLGIDLYRDANNAATFVEQVRALHRHGKPVVITEFGCCAFTGADDLGGIGFTVVDWEAYPPFIPEEYVRDEGVQARYIEELLDIFEAEGVHGAFVYDFIQPGSPHVPEFAPYDFDKACFAVVKCFHSEHELAYDTTGHFEPKLAFDVIARRFGDG